MIHGFYDNSIVAYRTGAKQTVNLVLDTIRLAVKKEKSVAKLQLHSAQGFQYASQACFTLTDTSRGHYSFRVKTGKLLRQRYGWKSFFHSQTRMYLSHKAEDPRRGQITNGQLRLFL